VSPRIALFAALLALALLAAGCGGGGGTATATAPLSKAQFIKRGDAICEKTDKTQNSAIRKYTAKHPKGASTKAGQDELITSIGLPPIQQEAEELGALGAPRGDEGKVEAIVNGIEEAVGKAEEEPESTNKAGAANPFTGVDKLAGEYGFKACAFAL
jgi:hypothetical protein